MEWLHNLTYISKYFFFYESPFYRDFFVIIKIWMEESRMVDKSFDIKHMCIKVTCETIKM